jgi:membrane protease subunit HflK
MASPQQPPTAQSTSERAARGGDVASQALNEALRTSFRLLKLAMVLVVVLFLTSGIFTVGEQEQVFVLRFGEVVRDSEGNAVLGTGIHFAWPFLIDEIVRYPARRNITVDIGDFWYLMGPDVPKITPATPLHPERGGYNITGDANILHSGWTVTYSIVDPVKLCQNLSDPAELALPDADPRADAVPRLIASLMRGAVIRTMARLDVDSAYGGERDLLNAAVTREIKQSIADLEKRGCGLGILIDRVTLVAVEPPPQVRREFASVTKAAQVADRLKSEAKGYADSIITKADGEGKAEINKAEEYRSRVVNQAKADAEYIQTLLEEYPDDPGKLSLLLEQRLLEVLQSVLAEADETFVTTLGKGDSAREVRVWVNRDPATQRENVRRRRLEREQGE